MRAIMVRAIVATLGMFVMSFAARAEEVKIPPGELPKPVLEAIKAKFPSAKITQAEKETEDGKTIYEVGLKTKGETIDIAITGAGKIMEVEKVVSLRELPRTVTAKIGVSYPGSTIKKAEEIVEYEDGREEKSYEVVVVTQTKKMVELKLSPEGKLLGTEEKAGSEQPGNDRD
jgi:hypothetical protein